MPLIVYKTMTLNAVWVQVRQIPCEHCAEPFHYLARGVRTVKTAGLPVVSSSEGMRKAVGDQLMRSLELLAKQPRQGKALCPHCQHYQSWIVRSSRLERVPKYFFVGGFLGASAGFVIDMMLVTRAHPIAIFWAILGVTLALGGAALGWKKSLPSGKLAGKTDPAAMMPEALEPFLAACQAKNANPALAWYAIRAQQDSEQSHAEGG